MPKRLKVFYTDDFKGHYPVGTSAIVLAETKEEAKLLLDEELRKVGLLEKNKDGYEIYELPHKGKPVALIINDGDY